MRQMRLALIGVASLMAFGVSSAEAAVTCKWVHSMCPDEPSDKVGTNHSQSPTSVPEPATLLLLGAGVSAVGAAVARRRKNKKPE
ncbi:MAG TPA: PEP-CTERM sorting domain-containing protein [Steroidobacteraceae bacterium]